MKLANMDFLFGITHSVQSVDTANSTPRLTFVDLCGGPGGFTEYLLGLPGSEGWGMSLTEAAGANGCGWRLGHVDGVSAWAAPGSGAGSAAAIPGRNAARGAIPGKSDKPDATKSSNGAGTGATRRRFTTTDGVDGTGDLYNMDNVAHLARLVLAWRPGGVDLVVADGGFLAARDRHDQELVVYRLIVCEVLGMLRVLRPGGWFVCKLFDSVLPCTVALLYCLSTIFEAITIVCTRLGVAALVVSDNISVQIKPPTSRPASGESYVICKGLLDMDQHDSNGPCLRAQLQRVLEQESVKCGEAKYLSTKHSILPESVFAQHDFPVFVRTTNDAYVSSMHGSRGMRADIWRWIGWPNYNWRLAKPSSKRRWYPNGAVRMPGGACTHDACSCGPRNICQRPSSRTQVNFVPYVGRDATYYLVPGNWSISSML